MKERLEYLLMKSAYGKIPSNVPEITLYANYMRGSVQAVQVMDYRGAELLTKEQYALVNSRARDFFHNGGYETVHLLTVILTDEAQEARKFVLDDKFCWIVDMTLNRLIIYENQPADFYGLRSIIESACEPSGEADGNGRYSREIQTEAESWRSGPFSRRKGIFERNYAPVNISLIIINIIVFIYLSIAGSTFDLEFMLKYGAMYVPYVMKYNEYYRFFSCMFLHFGIQHLAGNMVALFFLGDNVERALGKVKYLIVYIGSGLLGSAGSFTFAYLFNRNIVSAGASGAIFGIIGALLWVVIRNKGRLDDMTTFKVCLLIFYALYSGITGENIDNAAHIAGLLGGFLLAVILYERKRTNEN